MNEIIIFPSFFFNCKNIFIKYDGIGCRKFFWQTFIFFLQYLRKETERIRERREKWSSWKCVQNRYKLRNRIKSSEYQVKGHLLLAPVVVTYLSSSSSSSESESNEFTEFNSFLPQYFFLSISFLLSISFSLFSWCFFPVSFFNLSAKLFHSLN